jgi:hypothetical protein
MKAWQGITYNELGEDVQSNLDVSDRLDHSNWDLEQLVHIFPSIFGEFTIHTILINRAMMRPHQVRCVGYPRTVPNDSPIMATNMI